MPRKHKRGAQKQRQRRIGVSVPTQPETPSQTPPSFQEQDTRSALVEQLNTETGRRVLREEILRGNWEMLPEEKARVVRIFMSSTFVDFKSERDILLDKAYPELRLYCLSKGIDFQVVDMRWGVRDEVSADHRTTELCLEEIRNCQRLSVGPNFVAFLGNRYGYRPLPRVIPGNEMEILRASMVFNDITAPQLDQWYQLDRNAVPPEYILQPITAHYPHYADDKQENVEKRRNDRKQWMQTEASLRSALQKAAECAKKDELIDGNVANKYGKSVTQLEIECGIFNQSRAEEHVLCFLRTFHDINLGDKLACKYHDMYEGITDTEAQEYLICLKNKINSEPNLNKFKFDIEWEKTGVSRDVQQHNNYLNDVNETFVKEVKALIDRSLNASQETLGEDWLMQEVLHHASFSKKRAKIFCGRTELLDVLHKYISDAKNDKPMVVYGDSGVGKTSLMGKLAYDIFHKNKGKYFTIVRFIGTSASSSSIHDIITSICLQVCEMYKRNRPSQSTMDDFSNIVSFFQSALQDINKSQNTLVIILDCLDKLLPTENAHSLNWLPQKLPTGIKLIVSTVPETFGILEKLRKLLDNEEEQFLRIGKLKEAAATEFINTWLSMLQRTLTEEQSELLRKAYSKCLQPLFLRLMVDEAKYWTSFTPVKGLHLAISVKEAIRIQYERLEKQHGTALVQRALAYIVAARNGVTEVELDNLLSSDNVVLDDVYQYWSPPVKDLIRIPPILWTRLRSNIQDYLVESQADGKTVLVLYHMQFIEVAKSMYLDTEAKKKEIHSEMAHLFLGTWSNGRKKEIHLTHRNETSMADRKVEPQPLMFAENVYNFRKLRQLPYHLIKAAMIDELMEHCFGNYTWLNVKQKATNIQEIIDDFNMFLRKIEKNDEIILLRDTFRLLKPTMEFPGSTTPLAVELVGRLAAISDHYPQVIVKLVQEAKSWMDTAPNTILVPQNGCFQSPGGCLRATLIGHTGGINDIDISRDGKLMVTACEDSTSKIFDLTTDSATHTLLHPDSVYCVNIAEECEVVVSYCKDTQIRTWGIENGRLFKIIQIDSLTAPEKPLIKLIDGEAMLLFADKVHLRFVNFEGDERQTFILRDLNDMICELQVTADGKNIVTGHESGAVKVINSKMLDISFELEIHEDEVTALLPLGYTKFATSSKDKSIAIINVATGKIQNWLRELPSPVKCMSFNRDSNIIAVGCGNDVYLCGTTPLKILKSFTAHGDVINQLSFVELTKNNVNTNNNNKNARTQSHIKDLLLVSASKDESLRVWKINEREIKMTNRLTGMMVDVNHMLVNGDLIVSASTESQYIKLWDATPDFTHSTPMYLDDGVMPPIWTSNGSCVITQDSNLRDVNIHNMAKGELIGKLNCDKRQITCYAVSADDKYLISGGKDKHVRVRTIEDGRLQEFEVDDDILFLSAHKLQPKFAVCVKNSKTIIISIGSEQIEISDNKLNAGEIVTAFLLTENLIFGTNKGRLIVKECSTKASVILATKTSVELVKQLASSKDDRYIAIAGEGQTTINVWDVTKKSAVSIKSDALSVTALAISEDGSFVVGGTRQRGMVVWSREQGEEVTRIYVYSPVTALSINEDLIFVGTRLGFLGKYRLRQASDIVSDNTSASKTSILHDESKTEVSFNEPNEDKRVTDLNVDNRAGRAPQSSSTCVVL